MEDYLEEKEVWRVNTGNGVPSDYSGGLLTHSFAGLLKGGYPFTIYSYLWDIQQDDLDIQLYQTTRTKPAKCTTITCEDCIGSGAEMDWSVVEPIADTECDSCKGRGFYVKHNGILSKPH